MDSEKHSFAQLVHDALWKNYASTVGRMREGIFFFKCYNPSSDMLVRAANAASCDGALSIKKLEASDSQTNRFFRLYSDYVANKNNPVTMPKDYILFDVKSIYPRASAKTHGVIEAQYGVAFTTRQFYNAAFVVIDSGDDPDYVAIVPMPILHACRKHKVNTDMDGRVYVGLGTLKRSAAQSIDFPPILYPWVVRLDNVRAAFESIVASAKYNTPYTNPQTRITLNSWKPACSSLDLLMPRPGSMTSYDAIQLIFSKLSTSNCGFGLEFLASPMVGDFALHNSKSVEFFVVEHKSAFLHNRDDQNFVQQLYRSGKAGILGDRQIFLKEGALWDYFWTESKCGHAFVIPRDHIPEHWKDALLENVVIEPNSPLQKFKLRYDDGGKWIQSLKLILSEYGSAKKYFSIRNSNIRDAEAEDIDEQELYADENPGSDSEADDDTEGNTSGGIQHKSHKATLQYKAGEVLYQLQHECCEKGSGIAYWIGWKHKLGSIAMTRYEWSEDDKKAFRSRACLPIPLAGLPPRKPVIVLAFDGWRSTPIEWGVVGKHVGQERPGAGIIHIYCPSTMELNQKVVEVSPWIVPSEGIDFTGKTGPLLKEPFHFAYRHTRTPVAELYPLLMKFFSTGETETIGPAKLPFHPALYLHPVQDIISACREDI